MTAISLKYAKIYDIYGKKFTKKKSQKKITRKNSQKTKLRVRHDGNFQIE